jgi:hypothetical protein
MDATTVIKYKIKSSEPYTKKSSKYFLSAPNIREKLTAVLVVYFSPFDLVKTVIFDLDFGKNVT